MLSNTWADHLLSDKIRRHTLFGEIAKIMVSLNRVKLSRIGSLTLGNDGLIELENQPLTLRLQTFENEGQYQGIVYTSLGTHMFWISCSSTTILFYHQPNAIHTLKDGQGQFAALPLMRGLLPQFISRQYRDGLFVLTLTDLHASNIFVDENWHITSLIDCEWACSSPI